MESQQDWYSLLNSVLFTMHSHILSSTGYLLIKMLFKKDHILPFEMADKQNNSPDFTELCSDNDSHNHNDKVMTENDCNVINNVFKMVEETEKHKKEIQKAQKHQAKGYNNRHASGSTFEVGMKVLRKNSRQSLSKLRSKYLGPYTILSHCENGNFRLKDMYCHCLKTSFHPPKLVRFYEDQMYKLNEKGQVDCEVDVCDDVDIDMSLVKSSQNEMSSDTYGDFEDDDVGVKHSTECERVRQYNTLSKTPGPVTSTPIKSQIVIMSSQEMPPSSDESETN